MGIAKLIQIMKPVSYKCCNADCNWLLTDFELGRLNQLKYRFCKNCRMSGFERVECFQCRKYKQECTLLKILCQDCRKDNIKSSQINIQKKKTQFIRNCRFCKIKFNIRETGHRHFCSYKCSQLFTNYSRKIRRRQQSESKSYVK